MVQEFIERHERKFRKQLFSVQQKKIISILFDHNVAIDIKIFEIIYYDILYFCHKIE